ncbi:hypothetical protein DFJ74DRAFT_694943 [Hyaloraphidium curvatum]|nr:hypothetical protein DFJ74DRAFT_694943 [Hyaloraphidium curvatum]
MTMLALVVLSTAAIVSMTAGSNPMMQMLWILSSSRGSLACPKKTTPPRTGRAKPSAASPCRLRHPNSPRGSWFRRGTGRLRWRRGGRRPNGVGSRNQPPS